MWKETGHTSWTLVEPQKERAAEAFTYCLSTQPAVPNDGFFPTLMSIALGVLPRSGSIRVGWQGMPASVGALLRASSAGSALPRYGIGVGAAQSVLTPYTGVSLAGERSRTYRVGARWRVAPQTALLVERARRRSAEGTDAGNEFMLKAQLQW